MNENLPPSFEMNSQEYQNLFREALGQTLQSLPKPKVPSWMDSLLGYVQAHPWISLLVFLFIVLVISAVIREILCSYFKSNEILARLRKIEQRLNDVMPKRP